SRGERRCADIGATTGRSHPPQRASVPTRATWIKLPRSWSCSSSTGGRPLTTKQRLLPRPQLGHEAPPDGINGQVEAFEDNGTQQDRVPHDEGTHVKGAPQ